jgi:hypothetical protein
MGFNVKVDEDYLTIKLSSHLKGLKPECVRQIAEVLMSGNTTITDVIFKSLDGYVFNESLYAPGDGVTVHTDNLYSYRYDENAMREQGIIDENGHVRCTVKSTDKYTESMRVEYPAVNSSGENLTASWNIEMNHVVKTIGLVRPNLDELI